jgi:hypothetical protein
LRTGRRKPEWKEAFVTDRNAKMDRKFKKNGIDQAAWRDNRERNGAHWAMDRVRSLMK